MLAEPLKLNLADTRMFSTPSLLPSFSSTFRSNYLVTSTPSVSTTTAATEGGECQTTLMVSDTTQLTRDNISAKQSPTVATRQLKPYFEKPNKDIVEACRLTNILPKTVVETQVLRPVVFNTISTVPMMSVSTKDRSLYDQMSLRTTDKKQRQSERQQKYREKKKKEIVTRFLSFSQGKAVTSSVSTAVIQSSKNKTNNLISDIRHASPFFHLNTEADSQPVVLLSPVKMSLLSPVKMSCGVDNQNLIIASREPIPPCNTVPVKTMMVNNPNFTNANSQEASKTNQESFQSSQVKSTSSLDETLKKYQNILPHKQIDKDYLNENLTQNSKTSIVAFKTLHSPDTSQDSQKDSSITTTKNSVKRVPKKSFNVDQDSQDNSIPSTKDSVIKVPKKSSKLDSWKSTHEKGRHKKLTVKFPFKSPRKRLDSGDSSTAAEDEVLTVSTLPEIKKKSPDVPETGDYTNSCKNEEVVSLYPGVFSPPSKPLLGDFSFSLAYEENTTDASDRIEKLVLKLATEEAKDVIESKPLHGISDVSTKPTPIDSVSTSISPPKDNTQQDGVPVQQLNGSHRESLVFDGVVSTTDQPSTVGRKRKNSNGSDQVRNFWFNIIMVTPFFSLKYSNIQYSYILTAYLFTQFENT